MICSQCWTLIEGIGVLYSRPWVNIWQHELRQSKESQGAGTTDDESFLSSCTNKTTTYPSVSMKAEDLRIIQESLADDHQVFVDLVRSSRGSRLKGQEDIFTGRFWTAERAEQLGLIDGIDNVESYLTRRWGQGVLVRRWYQHPNHQ